MDSAAFFTLPPNNIFVPFVNSGVYPSSVEINLSFNRNPCNPHCELPLHPFFAVITAVLPDTTADTSTELTSKLPDVGYVVIKFPSSPAT